MEVFFSAATDEWVGGVDGDSLLTIEFSFKLLPINFPLLLCIRVRKRCRDGPVHTPRGSQTFVNLQPPADIFLCFWNWRVQMPKIRSVPGSLQVERLLTCCLEIYIHIVHYPPPTPIRPVEGSWRICGSVGEFVGLCKRPRKMFSDKLFRIPQSLLGRASSHAHPLFPSISQSLFQRALFSLCVFAHSHSHPATVSFTLPPMDPVLGQAVFDNGGN